MFKLTDLTPETIKIPSLDGRDYGPMITGKEKPIQLGQAGHQEIQQKLAPVIDKIKIKVFGGVMGAIETTSKAMGAVAGRYGIFKQDVPEIKPQGTISQTLANQPSLGQVVKKGVEQIPVVGKVPFLPTAVGMLTEGYFLPGGGKGKELKGLFEDIAKTSEKDAVFSMLKKKLPNIAEQDADALATKLAPITNPKEVEGVIKGFKPSVSAAETEKQLGYIKSVKESPQVSEDVKKVIPDETYSVRSTDELQAKALKQVQDNAIDAEIKFRSKTDDESVALGNELIRHYSKLADEATGAQKSTYLDKASEIAIDNAYKGLESGRAVQAFSTLNKMDPERLTQYAAKKIIKYNEELPKGKTKIPDLTGEQFNTITEAAKKIKGMPEGEAKNVATQKLFDEINSVVPSSLYQKIVAVYKAGMLTGLRTTGGNTLSNVMHGAMEITKDIPAFAVDKVTSLFTGERTIGLTTRGILKGTKEGFEKGWQYMKTGFDERDVGSKLDYKKVNFGTSKIAKGLQKYEETIFRLMGAEDQPFYYGAKAHSLYSQAIAQGKNQRLKGSELKSFIENTVQNPTDEMLRYAVQDAETAVFQNKTALSNIAGALQRAKGPKGGKLPTEIIIPFTRTPSAVATQVFNYSPAGIVKTIVTNIGKGKFDQREFAQGMGRGILGTGAMFIGTKLMEKGIMNLSAPTTEKERNLWALEGRIPNSIKVYNPTTKKNEWVSANYFGPAGNLLLIGGYFQRALEETGSPTQAMYQGTFGAAKSITDQTFLQGLSGALNAVNDPTRYAEQFAQSTAGSVVPTIVADFARATDEYNRDSKGIVPTVESRIPGVRETLPVKTDVMGEPSTPGIGFLRIMADPLRPSPEKGDEVVKELRRLTDKEYSVTPSSIKDKFKMEGIPIEFSKDQVNTLEELVGKMTKEIFTDEMQSEEYKSMSDEEKASDLNSLHEEILNRVRDRITTDAQIETGVKSYIEKEIKRRK
ncbi:hypothetical protein M0R04_09995 [Candidatus Dojkabacteria bacterium]|jgi:hypothetical protein|nr:hypothetical protein [Candidatus Dojkabacteria bacterium]